MLRSSTARLLLATALTGAFLVLPITPARAAGFVVDATGDHADADTSDGACATTGNKCTLRAAIDQANATPVHDTITFELSGSVLTISPAAPLPAINQPVTIDGSDPNDPTTPMVELNGSGAGPSAWGLRVASNGSTIRGLIVNRFTSNGIEILSGDQNVIENSYVGTNASGTAEASNVGSGIFVSGAAADNVIGPGNLVSGNNLHGVHIAIDVGTGNAPTGTRVHGNTVGTNLARTATMANDLSGVRITRSPNNLVGGTAPGDANVLAGNLRGGVFIEGEAADGNSVFGNYIGTNAAASPYIGNVQFGASVQAGADSNVIGGTGPGESNTISRNTGSGVDIQGAGTTGNLVVGNVVGLNEAGTLDLGNSGYGVLVSIGASQNQVGPGNVISGNDDRGVGINGSGTTSNVVVENLIGTDISGSFDVGNSGSGIIVSAPNTVIGGPGQGNVVSGNRDPGIELNGSPATGSTVQGNIVGLSADGTTKIGNTDAGIFLYATMNNLVGGAEPGEGNVVSGNTIGVRIDGAFASNNQVKGNLIGVATDGVTPLGNTTNGIQIGQTSLPVNDNEIGGIAPGEGNTIAFNTKGVLIAAGSRNSIRGNSIFQNGNTFVDSGIELDPAGVTLNDADGTDDDTGPNDLQNFPVIASAVAREVHTDISGSLQMGTTGPYEVDLYLNSTCDQAATGGVRYGEGKIYLGTATVNADGTFALTHPEALTPGHLITATATDSLGNTSEFSACHAVRIAFADMSLTVTDSPDPVVGGKRMTYTATVTRQPSTETDSANNARVTQTLPAGAIGTKATWTSPNGSGTCSIAGTQVSCNLGTFETGETGTVTVSTIPTIPRVVSSTFVAQSDLLDPDLADNTRILKTTVKCSKRGTKRSQTLKGTRGIDVICGLGGNDKILGLGGNDYLYGGLGNDTLIGGKGNDVLQGDAGTDVASFTDGKKSVLANLTTGRATGVGTDIMRTIESLVGSRFKDTLNGNGRVNKITGGAGADKLNGLGGNDVLYARDRVKDVLDGGKGKDKAQRDRIDKVKGIERYLP